MARIVFSEQFSHYKVNGDDDNGNDRDYKIEGGLYCDRIPVVPAGAMTVLFTLIPSLTLWSTMLIYTAMPESYTVWDWGPTLWYSDDLMAACLRRNPWQNVTLGPRRQSRHTSQPSRASGHKHGPPPPNPTCTLSYSDLFCDSKICSFSMRGLHVSCMNFFGVTCGIENSYQFIISLFESQMLGSSISLPAEHFFFSIIQGKFKSMI